MSESSSKNLDQFSPKVAKALKAARERGPMTAEDKWQQRVSGVYGLMGDSCTLTKEEVEKIMLEQGNR